MANGDDINTINEKTQANKNLTEAIGDLEKRLEGPTAATEKLSQAQVAAIASGEGLGEKLAGLAGVNSGFNKSLQNMVTGIGDANMMFEGFKGSITANFNAMAIGVSVVEKMVEATTSLIFAADNALVSFQKQTGAVSLYGANIIALEAKMYNLGIGMDIAAESQASLVTSMMGFRKLSSSAQEDLLETTALLAKMGVDSSITADSMQFMTASMGMTSDAAATTTRSMFEMAKSMGMPPQEMAQGFQAARPQLAAFGAQAGQVYMKLARNAREANMEVQDILRITEQFDKFDTAAASVGKLNAALGGPYLSTIRMVTTTDPTERMQMMSQAANDAGKSFDSMDYYERKMIASAMGLKDVNELALVMAGEFDLAAGAIELTTEQIIIQEKQLKDYNLIMEEFSQIMRSFAINVVGPIISGLKLIANGMTNLVKGPIPAVVGGIGLIIAAVGALWLAVSVASGGTFAILSAVAAFVITVGAGFLMIFKGILDVVQSSKPFMDKLTKAWEKITTAFQKFNTVGTEGSSVMEQITEGFNSFVKENEVAIDAFLTSIIGSLVSIVENLSALNKKLSASGAYYAFGKVIGHIAGFMVFLVTATMKVVEIFNDLFHMIFVGNSPPLLAILGLLTIAIIAIGNAFEFPIKMIGKLMSGLKDLAGLLAGKALSFLSGAMSYVFGTSPEAEVKNNQFDRQADMDRQATSIGEEVARAVKAALEGTQLNTNVALDIRADAGLPQLFDYFKRGVDDDRSGRSVNHALNKARSGIG